MSILGRTNKFKSKNIGSLNDYQSYYKYRGERENQHHQYMHEKKQRFIDNIQQDDKIASDLLKSKINKSVNKNKAKIVNQFTNLHAITIVIFSLISAILSCYGVTTTVNNKALKFTIFILTLILIIGNNTAIQPKLIISLKFNKSVNNLIGTSLLGIASLAIFVISIITNKTTLDMMNITDALLPLAFTFGFDISTLGLNFLKYSSAMFDVQEYVKTDLGVVDIQNPKMDIQKQTEDIQRNSYILDINKLIDKTPAGEILVYKQGSKYSSGTWNRVLNKRTDVIKQNGKYYKKGNLVINE